MTGAHEFGEQARPDTLRVTGVAALSGVDYDSLVADLQGRGLTVEPIGIQMPEVHLAPTVTVLGDVAVGAQTERETEPVGVNFWDVEEFATRKGISDSGLLIGTWNALGRAVRHIEEAKQWVAAGRPESEFEESPSEIQRREQLARLNLAQLPSNPGEDFRNVPLDARTLYESLAVVLAQGYPSGPSPLRHIGKRRLSFLASFVNERLQPDTPLPLYEDIAAGLEPLPPLYPRTLHIDSPYVQPIKTGRRVEAVVSRDDLHRFAVDVGVPANQTGYFLAMFRDMAALSRGSAPERQGDEPHWTDREVCFLRMHEVVGGMYDREVWGIRLERFVELVYDLERTPELRERVAGFGPQARKLLRQYLRAVAPHTPSVRPPEE